MVVVVLCPQCDLMMNGCIHLIFSFMLAKSADFPDSLSYVAL